MNTTSTIWLITMGGAACALCGYALAARRSQRPASKRSDHAGSTRQTAKDPRIARMQSTIAADAPTDVMNMDDLWPQNAASGDDLEEARTTALDVSIIGRAGKEPPPIPSAALKPLATKKEV